MNKAPVFPKFFNRDEAKRPLRALIDISAFKHNIQVINEYIGDSGVIVVVKADAYGHGLVALSRSIPDQILAVAIPDELVVLRDVGINNTVWVMEGFFSLSCLHHSESVVWVIHSHWQLSLLKQFALTSDVPVSVCLKLDTGMHRLGFAEDQLVGITECLEALPQVKLIAVMTHFSMSDEPFNQHVHNQIESFDRMLTQQQWSQVKQTLANSGGICFYAESHRDWVRPGIMLYGGKPSPAVDIPIKLKPVMCFQSTVIALHHVKQGDVVGYGGLWQADKDSLIATVAVGYADGYPRHAPNGTPVAVCTAADDVEVVSLVGRVSMDMITIDVSSMASVQIGSQVELWGEHVSVDEVARLSGTIAYDLLTAVSKRVPRIYR